MEEKERPPLGHIELEERSNVVVHVDVAENYEAGFLRLPVGYEAQMKDVTVEGAPAMKLLGLGFEPNYPNPTMEDVGEQQGTTVIWYLE